MQDVQNTVSAAEAVMSSLFGGIFLLAGLALLIGGAWLLAHRFADKNDGKSARATIVGYETRIDADGDTLHYPVLRTAFGGSRERDVKSSHGSEHRLWPIGTTVPIRYAPTAVEKFEIERPNHMGVFGFGLLVLGVGALSVSFQIAQKTLMLVAR